LRVVRVDAIDSVEVRLCGDRLGTARSRPTDDHGVPAAGGLLGLEDAAESLGGAAGDGHAEADAERCGQAVEASALAGTHSTTGSR